MCREIEERKEQEEKPIFSKSQFKRMVMQGNSVLMWSVPVGDRSLDIGIYPSDPVTTCEIYPSMDTELLSYGLAVRHGWDDFNPLIGMRQAIKSALLRYQDKFTRAERQAIWKKYFELEAIWQHNLEVHLKKLADKEEAKKGHRVGRRNPPEVREFEVVHAA